MTDLTRDKVSWRWDDAETNSFNSLKVAMATAPILRLPDFNKQFVVMTDASDVAVGAILEQDFGSGLQPIAFASRKLNATEMVFSLRTRNARHRMGSGTMETLFPKSSSHHYTDRPCASATPPESDIS